MEVEIRDNICMPGDEIVFKDLDDLICQEKVVNICWRESPFPKVKGKIYCAEVESGKFVWLQNIVKVVKNVKGDAEKLIEAEVPVQNKRVITEIIESFPVPSNIKVIMTCLVRTDLENLKVAQTLLNHQIQILEELSDENNY